MTEIEIEYCVPCGFLDSAVEAQQALLEAYGQDLAGVRLIPGHGGTFVVRVDGEPVFDKDDHGGYDLAVIETAVADQVGAAA